MSNVEVFFTRPGQSCEIKDRLLVDIKNAKERIYVAMAFITDNEISESLNNVSFNVEKKFVLNEISRSLEGITNRDQSILGAPVYNLHGKRINRNYSLMHHKFWIIDDILWLGSYNSTCIASEIHWENMIRIKNNEVVVEYLKEFNRMYITGKAIQRNSNNYFIHVENTEGNINTYCKICENTPIPGRDEWMFDNQVTHFYNHYFLSIDHIEVHLGGVEPSYEKEYRLNCSTLPDYFHRRQRESCAYCDRVFGVKSLIITQFIKNKRDYRNDELVDENLSRSERYYFCHECIMDALSNHKAYRN